MRELNNEILTDIRGGAISGSFLSAIAKTINSLLNLGRSLGNAIRRIQYNSICKL